MVSHGLIPHPPQPARIRQRFVIAWFLLLTAGAGLLDVLWAPEIPRPTGQEDRQRAILRANATWSDGTLMQVLDQNLADRSNLRAHLTPWYAGALITLLREAGEQAVVGKDDWLFLERRTHTPVALADETTTLWARALDSVDRQLRRRNSRLLVMPVPRRAVVCQEFLPAGFDPDRGYESALHDALASEGLDTVDLRPVFSEHDPVELFYRQDTHWSRLAQWLAARAVHERLGTLAPEDQWSDGLIDLDTAPDKQGLLNYGGVQTGTPAQRFWQPKDNGPALLIQDHSLKRDKGPDPGPLAVTGTSFSVGENFLGYLRLMGTEPVFKAARPGFFAWDTLDIYLRGRSTMHGTVLIEQLVGQIRPSDHRSTALEYMKNELQFLTAVRSRNGPNLLKLRDDIHVAHSSNAHFLTIPRGRFLSSGDGTLAVRLVRPPTADQDLRVVTAMGAVRWSTKWAAQRPEIHLPLITLDTSSSEIQVTVQGPGAEDVALEQVRVTTEFDLSQAVILSGGPAVRDGDVRVREFAMPPIGGPLWRSALHYRQGRWDGEVTIQQIELSGKATTLLQGELTSQGQAVLDLTPHIQDFPTTIRVTTRPTAESDLLFRRKLADSMSLVPLLAD